ncbi:TNF receptor-associated factor 3-like isoform X2 [Lingula anatina]|uniref:TNF receptor-associated factor 3-like isoform X2 n=1 Tax=Lingula anatina TaxID=7574 RepID=A0A1S3JI43_LINAN|nr:TNF receptor-associated factor 3-like isoform X2 [Lingula anatina]|eukprot:XP_013410062.1 TNF receptor-associated factor 3-like isoform X2 [Lingula anatina]
MAGALIAVGFVCGRRMHTVIYLRHDMQFFINYPQERTGRTLWSYNIGLTNYGYQENYQVFKDKSAHREMQRLEVYCSNKNYGCPKKMKWKELDKHSADCEYTPECCAFCGNLIPRIQTNHHQTEECSQRPVACRYCLQQVPFSEYETHIDETCLEVQVDCPHKCGATGIKRGELEEHFRICQAKPAECPYRVYGCEFQGTQPEVKTHEDEDKVNHIHLLAVQLGRLELDKMEITRKTEECQNQLDALKNQVQSFEADNEQHKQTAENFEKKMKSLQVGLVAWFI